MVKVLISIPVVEMEIDKLPDDRGSLDCWVHRALQVALQLQDDDVTTHEQAVVILANHGLSQNPFDGCLWEIKKE